MTTRQAILTGVATLLSSIPALKAVRLLHDVALQEVETLPSPYAVIYPLAERSHPVQVIGREVWDMDVAVEIWSREKNIEDLIGDVTKKLYTSVIHSSVHEVKRVSIENLYPEMGVYGARVVFTLVYSHLRESP